MVLRLIEIMMAQRFQRKRSGLETILIFFFFLAKNVAAFCHCLKSLPEANLESFGLMVLAGEVLRQPGINCVA